MPSFFLVDPGPRPSHGLAAHLWGAGCDVDSDGNSTTESDRNWTELTLILRPACQERIDVDPLDYLQPLVLVIRSEDHDLASKTALFLHRASGGTLSDTAPNGRRSGS